MKKTEYFISSIQQYNQAEVALDEVVKKRDAFLDENKKIIGQIDFEKVEIIRTSQNNIYALLTLAYYLK